MIFNNINYKHFLLQVFVETLDKCFENVCELDLIFHVDKVKSNSNFFVNVYFPVITLFNVKYIVIIAKFIFLLYLYFLFKETP